MNKKQLIIAAMAAVLSVTGANATSTITGITNGGSGTFNINPEQVNGNVGYRAYDNFKVGNGDIANLIYKYNLGDQRDISTFINLVKNNIDVQGIVNSLDGNGNFYNGHAVFISPNGLTVGASGVLNVGTLSVATPTQSDFNSLMSEYNAEKFVPTKINQISKMKQDGNAPINIQGYVFARNGIDLPGTNINVSGKVVNGMAESKDLNYTTRTAEALFNTLVNTDGTIKADAAKQSNGSLVFLHSFNKGGSSDGINVSGTVANLTAGNPAKPANGSVALTSAGANGVTVSGNLAANGKLSVYSKAGDMNISGKLQNQNGELALTNGAAAGSMTLASTAKLVNAKGDISVINNGKGALSNSATANASGALNIVNDAATGKTGGLTVAGSNDANTVRIVNRAGTLSFPGKADANESVSFRNWGTGGMEVGGTVNAKEGVLLDNHAGALSHSGSVGVANGNIAVMNRSGAGALSATSSSNMKVAGKGFIAIKNESASGSTLNGKLETTDGEIALNNNAGAMTVNGTITNTKGNTGIINRGTGAMSVAANINNMNGTLKMANVNGKDKDGNGFTIEQSADIKNNGQMFVYNDNGKLTINGSLANQNNNLYVVSRANSTGITTSTSSSITNTGSVGNLAIKQKAGTTGTTAGLDLNGTISNETSTTKNNVTTYGQTAINNYGTGDMHVGGSVTSNGQMGIVNRAQGGTMNVNATINANGSETNIKNLGRGNMTVAGEINHTGRLNILGNTNKTTLAGTINNQNTKEQVATLGAKSWTYAASRANGTGLEATSDFKVNSDNGDILIKNITGTNGLNFAGTINSTNGQAEVYNKAGSMTVANTANVSGNKAFILNGNGSDSAVGLTVNSTKLPTNIMIVNKGSQAATVPQQYRSQTNFREKLRK